MKKYSFFLIFTLFTNLIFAQEANTMDNSLSDENKSLRKAFDSFKPDLKKIGESTAKWDTNYINKVSYDVIKFAEAHYIKSVDITLVNSENVSMKTAKYYVNVKSKQLKETDKTNMNWPNTENSSLAVVLHYNSLWHSLTNKQKTEFMNQNKFKISWINSNIDETNTRIAKN